MNPIEFQRKWIGVELKERSAAQEHFLDLCRVMGHPTPAEMDREGSTFTFERGAAKSIGGQGWADVWYRGHFAWEYKGPHKDLVKAYDQLLRYKDDLENPPLLIVSDLNIIDIHTNFTATPKKVHRIDLHTFADATSQDVLRRVFYDPDTLKPDVTVEEVTLEAARRFGAIAQGMQTRGEDPHRSAHYLMQLLFCLFAEDVRLLPNGVFSKMVAAGVRHPVRFDAHAAQPDVMHCGGLTEAKRIAALVDMYTVPIAPHNPGGPICTLAWMHLAAAIPSFLVLEQMEEERPLRDTISTEPVRFVDGAFVLPESPGLGTDLKLDLLADRPVRPQPVSRPTGTIWH